MVRPGIDTAVFNRAVRRMVGNLGLGMAGGQGGDRLIGVENPVGSRFGDALVGNFSANTLWGGAGHHTLLGRAGDDRLWRRAGHDSLDGGIGTNTCLRGEDDTNF